jgi:hypothetical protein
MDRDLKWRRFAELQRFSESRWCPLAAFLLQISGNVSSIGGGPGISASSHMGYNLKGTKVSNLYDYIYITFLTIPGIFGSPPPRTRREWYKKKNC